MILSILLLIILGVTWASGYAIAGYVMNHGVSPYGYALWQSFGPFLCLFLIQLIRRDIKVSKQGFVYALICAVTAIVIPNLLIYFAAQYLASGILTVLANVAPIFTYPLAIIFGQERFKLSRFSFIVLGFIGILLIILPASQHLFINFSNAWLYLALLIPFGYALGAVFIARFRPESGNVLNYSMWMLLISTLLLSPLTLSQGEFYPLVISDFNSWLIMLEVILSAFGYVLLFLLIKRVGPVYYTLVNAIAALTGVLYGVLLFKQVFTWQIYLAIAIILLAIVGLTYSNRVIKGKKDS